MTRIIWKPLLSDLDKKAVVIYGVIKTLPFSEKNRGKLKGRTGGKKGRLQTTESKRLFNCVWRRAESTAVNNLCAAETLDPHTNVDC